ncbi:DUF488 domain-containing protein [Jeotgalibacillus haloalkalitolerans]|uniref:DUF488 domain-containing protein n=1 Tax=Jeotgalibacillus haloalkalitolerans TaxID=3104292 RepID=A0ABU5KJ22_9BACL|nr:DUF488 domain-containing protein [Jeotgalibacillus sp. HH7-29]MDZ5710746.1 DUF488 domain-containing protein [Jeotgalibacillus sp. HH7-29]
MNIYTIGHYNHAEEEFLNLLKAADITFIADVRAFPGSRRSPQFKKENLQDWLKKSGIGYQHFPELGGRRRISGVVGEDLNAGWENRSFHNYADYTLTDEFKLGVGELMKLAEDGNVAYMCSEHHPARCHRLIISNWLQANGWNVHHIIPGSKSEPKLVRHELGKWGAVPVIEEGGEVVYPLLK